MSLRSKIFREVIANLLVHPEFTGSYPALLFIYKDKVVTENANCPIPMAACCPKASLLLPKPCYRQVLHAVGYVDELGSGILNVNMYLPFYAPGKEPLFDEGDVFKMTIPLKAHLGGGVNKETGGVFGGVNNITKMRGGSDSTFAFKAWGSKKQLWIYG